MKAKPLLASLGQGSMSAGNAGAVAKKLSSLDAGIMATEDLAGKKLADDAAAKKIADEVTKTLALNHISK